MSEQKDCPVSGGVDAVTSRDVLIALREWFGGERYARDYEYLDMQMGPQMKAMLEVVFEERRKRLASAPAPAGGVDAVVQTAEKVRMSRRRHGGTYESSPFEFYPVQEVDALLHAIDLGGKIECEECSGTGHTGIDGDEVYDCPACNGEGSLSPAATPVSEAGGEAIQQWRWRCRNGEPAAWCDWKDGNPVVPFSEWNAEIYEWEKRTVYLAKAASSPAGGDVDGTTQIALGHFKTTTDRAQRITVLEEASVELLSHLELYDFTERDPSGDLHKFMAALKAALSQSTAGRGE